MLNSIDKVIYRKKIKKENKKMKSDKKIGKISLVVLLIIAILIGIYFIYHKNSSTEKEFKSVEMKLPDETNNLLINIEGVKLHKGSGSDSVVLIGWVLRQNVKDKKKNEYLVLKSDNDTLIFKITKADQIRNDVQEYFNLDKGINNHGFEISIPISFLKESNYQVGFIIEDSTGKNFMMAPRTMTISNGIVTLTTAQVSSKSSKVNITFKAPTAEIKYNLETVNLLGNNLNINGWAFLQGMNTDMIKSFVLLKKNDAISVFPNGVMERKDVTDFFKETRLNLDSAGFATQIATEKMEKGHYQVGLYIEKGNHAGLVYSNKFVDIGK